MTAANGRDSRPRPTLGDNVFEKVGTFHTLPDGTIVPDEPEAPRMNLAAYWRAYDATLARIREERPDTFAALKAILDRFEPSSSGDAFFPGGADDTLADALHDAGWAVEWLEGDYLWHARHPRTLAHVEHVEGDLYDRTKAVQS